MATTYNLAPIPRWQFTLNTGLYDVSGLLYTFRATSPSEPKAVYQDPAGTIPFPNPIVLDGVGSIGPIYWASDENYYIELRDSTGTQKIWSVDDFNAPNAGGGPAPSIEVDYDNHIINGQFDVLDFDNVVGTAKTLTNGSEVTYGWTYEKDGSGGTNTCTFTHFTAADAILPIVEATPRYYLLHTCSGASTGATYQDYVQTLGTVEQFANQQITFSILAKGFSGTQTLQIWVYQDFGTGGTTPPAILNLNLGRPGDQITLTSSWDKYSDTATLGSLSGKVIGTGSTIKVRIRVPLNATCSVGFTNIQWNLGDKRLAYQEQIPVRTRTDVLIKQLVDVSPINNWNDHPTTAAGNLFNHKGKVPQLTHSTSTGQMGFSWGHDTPPGLICAWSEVLNIPTGWLYCDGSTYSSTTYSDLYGVLLQRYGWGNGMLGVSNVGTLAQVTNYMPGACTAPSDGGTGFTLTVSTAGCTLGTDCKAAETANYNISSASAYSDGIKLVANDRILLIGQTNPKENGLYKFVAIGSPIVRTAETGADIAQHAFYVSNGITQSGRTYYCTNASIIFGTTDIAFNRVGGRQVLDITCTAASTFNTGSYFLVPMADGTTIWQVVMVVDGVMKYTSPLGVTNISYAYVASTATAADVATAVYTALNPSSFAVPDYRGLFLRGADGGAYMDIHASTRLERGDGTTGDYAGTGQLDAILAHYHVNPYGVPPGSAHPGGGDHRSSAVDDRTSDTSTVGGDENLVRNRSVIWIIKAY